MNKHLKEIFTMNLFYMFIASLLLTLGVIVQQRDLIIGLLITEWVLIFLPAFIFVRVKKIRLKDLNIQPLTLRDGILTILITVFSYPIVVFVSLTFNFILSLFVEFDPVQIPLPRTFEEYLIYLPVISLSAGICEEFFFRGVMLWQYRGLGKRNAIIISSLLFGLFHFNYQNLIGPILLGIIFGYLVYKTGSIFAGIIGHMTNNFISLTLGYMVMTYSSEIEQNTQGVSDFTGLISAMISWGIMAFISLQVVKWLIGKIGKNHQVKDVEGMRLSEMGKMPWIPIHIVIGAYLVITLLSFNI
ncbi:MAG: CPBP family intramembrane metalloprotease [Clostridia bacterium]|nr:CPBP family intramembrane metalloprotease [Clostridia bacterium]